MLAHAYALWVFFGSLRLACLVQGALDPCSTLVTSHEHQSCAHPEPRGKLYTLLRAGAVRQRTRSCDSAGSRARADRLKTSAAMGTVELTGLEMMATNAAGQYLAMATHRSRTMPACPATAGYCT